MIPPDAALPDISIFALFWQAHWIVKTVMIGLMACSVWVWAIAVDKFILYSRTARAMDGFEQSFWSGQSLEELYRMVSARPRITPWRPCSLLPCGNGNAVSRGHSVPSRACKCVSRR